MKAAVPVAAIRQTWKCSGSVQQWHNCITVALLYQFFRRIHRGAGRHGLAAITPGGSEISDPTQ